MSTPLLSGPELRDAMTGPGGPEWELIDGCLVKTVACHGFVGALAFVGEMGMLAEQANHHPDIDIRYNRVRMVLVTHDAGGITQEDIDLARGIDRIAERLG
ncbi:MAG: 4a-hydroxytetrahydrobiopterin dehydratase [Acidimicrobiales bacterium]